jgi:hypothetical protein
MSHHGQPSYLGNEIGLVTRPWRQAIDYCKRRLCLTLHVGRILGHTNPVTNFMVLTLPLP